MYKCVGKVNRHWWKQWFVAYQAPSHDLKQCWLIVNSTHKNEFGDIYIKISTNSSKKMHLKTCLQHVGHFVLVSMYLGVNLWWQNICRVLKYYIPIW